MRMQQTDDHCFTSSTDLIHYWKSVLSMATANNVTLSHKYCNMLMIHCLHLSINLHTVLTTSCLLTNFLLFLRMVGSRNTDCCDMAVKSEVAVEGDSKGFNVIRWINFII